MLLLAHQTTALNISFTLPCHHWISLVTLQSWSPRSSNPVVDSEVPVDGTVKEGEVDFNPDITEEADIVGGFLGV